MNNESIIIRMDGKEFQNEKNLYLMIEALTNMNRIFEKAYLTINNKKRMSEKDREIFQLKAKEFKEGSLIIELGMFINTLTQSSLFDVLVLNPTDIWTLIKEGYNYLMMVLNANRQGISLRLKGNNNTIVLMNGNDNIAEFRREVVPYLTKSESNFERLSSLIDPAKGVDEFSLFNVDERDNDKITFNVEQKDLFDTKTKLENQVITLKGRIFNLDASDCTGELKVIESDDKDLKVNTICKFDFVQNVSEENFLSDIFLKKITIYALKEIYFNPVSLKTEIKKIRIINVRK